MKKILALILASMMLLTLVACGNTNEENTTEEITTEAISNEENNNEENTTEENNTEVKSAEEMLNATVESFLAEIAPLFGITVEEVKEYFTGGYFGESEDTFCTGAAKVLPLDDEYAVGTLMSGTLISEENLAKIDDAANFTGMNANNFTTFVYHVKNSADVAGIASDFESAVTNNMWFCGFPEVYFAIQVGDYIFAGFGLEDQVNVMKTAIAAIYENATVLCEGVIL